MPDPAVKRFLFFLILSRVRYAPDYARMRYTSSDTCSNTHVALSTFVKDAEPPFGVKNPSATLTMFLTAPFESGSDRISVEGDSAGGVPDGGVPIESIN